MIILEPQLEKKMQFHKKFRRENKSPTEIPTKEKKQQSSALPTMLLSRWSK